METGNRSRCHFCSLENINIAAENRYCVAFYDGYPVSPGHTLIIPKRHVANYFDLTVEETEAMHSLMLEMKERMDSERHPDGYNIGINVNEAAGQSVFHVHMHLIPRYKGDMDDPKGGVRGVIPDRMKY